MPRASGTSSRPSRARWNIGTVVMSTPSMVTVPSVGATRPAATEHSVDLPAPFAPRRATTFPGLEADLDAVEHLDVAVAGDDALRCGRRGGDGGTSPRPAGGGSRRA